MSRALGISDPSTRAAEGPNSGRGRSRLGLQHRATNLGADRRCCADE